jgi:hypothetical protein
VWIRIEFGVCFEGDAISKTNFRNFRICPVDSSLEVRFEAAWATGVWGIVRIPPDTLADGQVKKHPLEYGLSKVFPWIRQRAAR